ncbi:MAG: nuclear transport factor 2 family protein [Acidimicrobiia bacterium]|nr:nuclear transport factor 2 family protein [Acidimicrobiia bacterium]
MTAEETVNAFIAAVEAKDLDAAMAHVADDCYYENVPIGGMTGPEEMKKFLAPMFGGDGPVEFEVLRQVANDTTVMNDRIDRFVMRGRQIELPVAGVFEVEDDKITLWRDFFDEATFTRAVRGE